MKRTKNSANKVWRLRVVTAQEADHGGAVGNGNDNDAGAAREEMARVGDRLDGEEIAAEIDDVLHRRHLSVYGKETMQRLSASNVLISGMSGLGAEIAKNIALAGVKSVTLHDVGNVEMWDLSANFFLTEDDIGRNRAISCVAKLQELNNSVLVSALTNELTIEHLSKFQVVVFTDIALDKTFEFNEYCRIQNPPIPFIKTEVCGLFGSIFCDFGPEFVVVDVDGHPPHTGTIASISNGNPAIVTCVDDEHLDFNDGDFIIFSEVQGMTELNDGIPRKIKVAGQFSLCIQEDTTNFGSYTKGGIVTQVKQPKILQFKSLRDSIEEPGNAPLSVCSNLTSPPLLHIAFLALDKFRQEVGRLPKSGCDLDAQQFVKFATALNEARIGYKMHGAIDEKSLQLFASGSKAVLSPMCAIFGGIVGQEVVKACSGKFHPLHQFFYFDSLESLPTYQLQPHDLEPLNCRYDAQISVFGSKLQRKMWNANVLIFGSGVLGCEYLKCLALMGLSCGPSGKLTITDDDEIDISHLSCQFLFRTQNIGQAKSIVSAAAAKTINPDLHIDPLVDRMCQESEFKFNYAFWESFDVVMSTVNNVKARKYMKMKCLYFHKPLLESGTMATQFTTQIIIPHISQSYGFLQEHCENGAIATSASLATGFVCLELYKVLSGVHQRSEYRNTIGDFSRPFIKVARPVQPNVNKHGELTWTAWDRWSIGVSNITFSYLINWLSQYDVTVDRVYAGRSLLLNTRDPQHEARLDKLVGDIAKQVAGNNVAENMTFLDICVKCVDGYGNPISLPVITINTSPIIVDKPPITTDVPPIPFEEFIKENELVKLITVETRSKPVKNSIGEKILSSIYRHIITTYRNGQSYGGRFTLRHLFVSKDNELCIAMKPEMESHPDNLEKDLRKVALLVLPKFRFDLQYPPFIRHLNKISEKMPVEAKLSKGALEIFLDIVYHHFAFTRAMDVHYLIIGLATSYNSLGTEDQLIIRTALEKVANYLELPFTWNWIGTVKSFTTMSNVIEKSKGKKDLSHAYHGSTALGAFMFSRHNGIHGAQNALVPLLEEGDSDQPQGESNPWSSTSASNLETEQQIDSPVYFFHVMAFGLGEVIAHSILCILMHADITMRKYITKVWKAYTREDDSD